MRISFLSLLLTWLFISPFKAQNSEVEVLPINKHYFDVAVATNINQSCLATSYIRLFPIALKKKFNVGYGIRFNNQIGKNLGYATAPAKLTSKMQGPQVLFSKIYYENIDTISVHNAQVNSINLSINLEYKISSKLGVGFNIDAIGFSFGKKTTGKYQAYQDPARNNSEQTVKPTPFNVLLVSDNDIGSLNSELFISYHLTNRLGIRFGATFIFTEYTSDVKLRLENDRWRSKSLQAMIGISYSPFN